MKAVGFRLLIVSLVCVAATSARAQERTGARRLPEGPLGQVTSLRGKGAKVSHRGGPSVPLKVGDVLRPGDAVTTGKATLEVTLGDPKDSARGDRVSLGKKTRALLDGLGDAVDLTLEEGEVFGVSPGELKVRAGRSVVTLHDSDARIELSRKGTLVVEVHMGFVSMVTGGGEEVGLKGGDRAKVDERGRLGKTKRFTPRPSKWLAALRFVDPRAVLLHASFDDEESLEAYEAFKGTLQEDGTARGATTDDYFAQRVHIGNSQPKGGLFRCAKGTRVRLRYRISAPTKVTIQCFSATRKQNFLVSFQASRVGVWTEVEFPIERFGRTGRGPRPRPYLRAGEFMVSLSIYAGKRGEAVVLEVDELLIFDPPSPH